MKQHRYTKEEDAFLLELISHGDKSLIDVSKEFVRHFNSEVNVNAVHKHCWRTLSKRKYDRTNAYSEEEDRFLLEIAKEHDTLTDVAIKFKEHFNSSRSIDAIRNHCRRKLNIHYVNKGRYIKGNDNGKSLPIGSERIDNGTVFVKVSDEPYADYHDNWKNKARVIWEQHYGEIPESHVITHLDGNCMNFDIENLYCLPKVFSAILSRNGWWTNSREHNLVAIEWCKLFYSLKESEVLKND